MRSEAKVILGVIGSLMAVTLALRIGEPWLSQDVRHIKQIPAIVDTLAQDPAPRVLFLSNSLTRASIQPDVFVEDWAAGGLQTSVGRIYPDDTNIADWTYVYRRYVLAVAPKIDVLVICFANDQLADTIPNPERLGEFGGLRLLPEAFTDDVTSLSSRIRYVLGATSRLWLDKERVQVRFLALLPGYKAYAANVNQFTRETAHGERSAETFKRLARFLCTVPPTTKVVFVATPLLSLYGLPVDLRQTINAAGAQLINMQGFAPLVADDFRDGYYHLTDQMAARFSKALAAKLEPIVTSKVSRPGCS